MNIDKFDILLLSSFLLSLILIKESVRSVESEISEACEQLKNAVIRRQ